MTITIYQGIQDEPINETEPELITAGLIMRPSAETGANSTGELSVAVSEEVTAMSECALGVSPWALDNLWVNEFNWAQAFGTMKKCKASPKRKKPKTPRTP